MEFIQWNLQRMDTVGTSVIGGNFVSVMTVRDMRFIRCSEVRGVHLSLRILTFVWSFPNCKAQGVFCLFGCTYYSLGHIKREAWVSR